MNVVRAQVKRYTLPLTRRLAEVLSLQVKLATMVPCGQLPQIYIRARNKRIASIMQWKYHAGVLSPNILAKGISPVLVHFLPCNGEDAFLSPGLDFIESKMESYWHLAIDHCLSSYIPLLSSNKHNGTITSKLDHRQGAYQRCPKVSRTSLPRLQTHY